MWAMKNAHAAKSVAIRPDSELASEGGPTTPKMPKVWMTSFRGEVLKSLNNGFRTRIAGSGVLLSVSGDEGFEKLIENVVNGFRRLLVKRNVTHDLRNFLIVLLNVTFALNDNG